MFFSMIIKFPTLHWNFYCSFIKKKNREPGNKLISLYKLTTEESKIKSKSKYWLIFLWSSQLITIQLKMVCSSSKIFRAVNINQHWSFFLFFYLYPPLIKLLNYAKFNFLRQRLSKKDINNIALQKGNQKCKRWTRQINENSPIKQKKY